ncbi:DUF255 domain-containing protein [bacterium]|nr:DUF255 domain-containing protein [bacterium]
MINNFKHLTIPFYIIVVFTLWYLQSELYINAIFYKVAIIYFFYVLWRETEPLFSTLKVNPSFKKKLVFGVKMFWASLFFLALYIFIFPQVSVLINSKQKYAAAKHNNEIQWHSAKEPAFKQARAENKPLIIEFFADWCMPCRQMEINTFSDQNVQSMIGQNYIPLKVDATQPNKLSNHMMRTFRVNAFPSIILLDQQQNKQKRLTGYIDAYQLKKALQSFLEQNYLEY